MNYKIFLYILVMAGVTYFVRMLPFVAFRRRIRSRFFRSMLYYMPYSVLGSMTIPWIFYSTGDIITSAAGFIAAFVLAYKNRSLIEVALAACIAAFVVGLIVNYI